MTRRQLARKFIYAISIIFLLVLILFPYNRFLRHTFDETRRELGKRGVVFDAQELSAHFPNSITFSGLGIQFIVEGTLVPLLVDSGELKLVPSLSLFFKPKLAILGRCYMGVVNLIVNYGVFDSSVSLESNFSDLRLETHPILHFLGLSGQAQGSLETKLERRTPAVLTPVKLDGVLEINDGAIESGTPLFPIMILPKITNISAKVEVLQDGDRFLFPKALLTSSLGDLAGKGAITVDQYFNIVGIKASAIIRLTEEGATSIGGFIAMAAGQAIDTPIRKWKVTMRQRPGYQISTRVEAVE